MSSASAKVRTYLLLEAERKEDPAARATDVFLAVLIVANVAAVMLSTVERFETRWAEALALFEVFSVAVFTVEYVLRVWSSTADAKYAHPVLGRLRFMARPLLVVDLLAILPTYLGVFFVLDLRFVRVLRLLRMFKLTRHSPALAMLGRVLKAQKSELLLSLFVFAIALVFMSSAMYFLETDAQPAAFGSIPEAMWWGVVTMATVGYGDIYPVTGFGRLVGGVFIVLGIAIYAFPVAILTSGFTDELRKGGEGERCPHCGKAVGKR